MNSSDPSDTSSMPSNPSGTADTQKPSQEVPSLQQICQTYLPDLRWITPDKGLCQCPGHSKHTLRSTKKDCAVFIGGDVPTVSCFHSSCHEEIAAVNDQIRTAWRLYQPELSTEARQAMLELRAYHERLESRALASKPTILSKYKWDDILNDTAGADGDFARWKSLFKPTDTIWCGEVHESGQWFHKACFQAAEEMGMRGHFGCASTFRSGSFSRSNQSVDTSPFLVVEGDAVVGKPETENDKRLNKLACAAVFRWLRDEIGLNLRCVIDSGNKSLHGWFDMPNSATKHDLEIILPALGCDKAMFKPAQPVRIPGIIRENGNWQKLLYFK